MRSAQVSSSMEVFDSVSVDRVVSLSLHSMNLMSLPVLPPTLPRADEILEPAFFSAGPAEA